MADHHIYHWKHGWIPLDHLAALKKSKGSEPGARRYLAGSHAAGHAHESVVSGEYGGGTHVRGLQPVAAGHLPRERHIVAAFNPDSRRFALQDPQGRVGSDLSAVGQHQPVTLGIPERLAEHIHARGHRITRLVVTGRGDRKVEVATQAGDHKLFAADGSDIQQVDSHVIEPPATPTPSSARPPEHSAADGTSSYVASHTVTMGQHSGTSGRRYGVIRPVNGMGSLDIIHADVADRITASNYKVIGFERKVITTVGPDGIIRRYKSDGSNVNKPVIAKGDAGKAALRNIGDWTALHPSEAIPTTGPKPVNGFKVQRAYRRGNKTVLIEPKLTEAETEAFLGHVGQAFDLTKDAAPHAVTVHVPAGDRTFSSGRTMGYVYRGDSTRVHVAPSVAKASIDPRAADKGGGGWLMSAGSGVHPTLYTLTHELGHVVDNHRGHTYLTQTSQLPSGRTVTASAQRADAREIHRHNAAGLSRYGSSSAVEGYAEAFAHHHLAPHSTAPTDSLHDQSAAAYAHKYGWPNVTSWRNAPDALIVQAAERGDTHAIAEARRRGLR